jgi:uncharacterized phage protein (TIGR02220 family)
MAKDPAVLFYTSDFLSGTMLMRNDQVGKYIKLLCIQHQQGHLSEEDMLEICGTYDERIFSKFVKDENGLYYNVRMEVEANKRRAYIESRSNNRKGNKNEDMKEHMNEDMSNHMTPHMENENINENINKDIDIIKDIVAYLNNKLNAKYRYTTQSIQKHIKARLNEGFGYEDFVTVIDKKYDAWHNTEMAMYLRPETLFGTKFQSYLNEKGAQDAEFGGSTMGDDKGKKPDLVGNYW